MISEHWTMNGHVEHCCNNRKVLMEEEQGEIKREDARQCVSWHGETSVRDIVVSTINGGFGDMVVSTIDGGLGDMVVSTIDSGFADMVTAVDGGFGDMVTSTTWHGL